MISPSILLFFVALYFGVLLWIAFRSARGAGNQDFFIGHRSSRWYLVAYGMIGTSLSGVTFMSVPGDVAKKHWLYLQIVLGYFLGYLVVAYVLLPLYYRLQLTSIYSYLKTRFGNWSYKTGASFFLLSRMLGASIRIFLVLNVLQLFLLNDIGIPFEATVFIILLMIVLYTFKGGVKTIVWTDTLQTTFMILALIVTVYWIGSDLHLSLSGTWNALQNKGFTQTLDTDYKSKTFFIKQLISGMFITISMTGLDQEMMQKNISCRNLKDAQKNMIVFSIVLVLVNLLFLVLGGMLYLYLEAHAIALPTKGDDVFPTVALHYLPAGVGLIFIIGLISALFPSADGAMTALTSSVCIDLLGMNDSLQNEEEKKRKRQRVHIGVALVFFLCILFFKQLNDGSVISTLLLVASYTYGPLLGLYTFGLFTNRIVRDKLVPYVCINSPLLSFALNYYSPQLFSGYQIGFELLPINGFITFIGLWLISKK